MAIVISIILLFLGIAVLVLIHVCIVGRTLRSSLDETAADNNGAAERGSLASTSMSRDDIEKLPCFDFTAAEAQKGTASPPPSCAVCLESFSAGEKCKLLPTCSHSFHAECVDLWLRRVSFCPICRADADTTRSGSLSCGGESSRFMGEVIGAEAVRDESGGDVAGNGEGQLGHGDDDVNADEEERGSNLSKGRETESASFNDEVVVGVDCGENNEEMESAGAIKEVAATVDESASLNEVTIDIEDDDDYDRGTESASLKEVTVVDSQSQ